VFCVNCTISSLFLLALSWTAVYVAHSGLTPHWSWLLHFSAIIIIPCISLCSISHFSTSTGTIIILMDDFPKRSLWPRISVLLFRCPMTHSMGSPSWSQIPVVSWFFLLRHIILLLCHCINHRTSIAEFFPPSPSRNMFWNAVISTHSRQSAHYMFPCSFALSPTYSGIPRGLSFSESVPSFTSSTNLLKNLTLCNSKAWLSPLCGPDNPAVWLTHHMYQYHNSNTVQTIDSFILSHAHYLPHYSLPPHMLLNGQFPHPRAHNSARSCSCFFPDIFVLVAGLVANCSGHHHRSPITWKSLVSLR